MAQCSMPAKATATVPQYSQPTPQCTGGRVLQNGQCVCPSGTTWNGTSCVQSGPTPQQQCEASGGHWYNNQCIICPAGSAWNGSQCVATAQKPGSPSAPQEIAQSAQSPTQASLTILWTPGSGATSQDIIDPLSGQVFAAGLPAGTNEYTIENLYAGATVHVAVRANNSAGSTTGPTVAFVLPCPAGYTATGGGCQQNVQVPGMLTVFDCSSYQSSDLQTEVAMCWNLDPNAASYVVRDSMGFQQNVGNTGVVHLSGLSPGQTIWAQVAGVNSAGQQGPWSSPVYMTTQAGSSGSGGQTISAWDCSSGLPSGCIGCCFSGVPSNAAEVTIQHVDANGNILGVLADYVQGDSAQVCGLVSGGIEHWRVEAYDDNGNLVAYSNIVQSTAQ